MVQSKLTDLGLECCFGSRREKSLKGVAGRARVTVCGSGPGKRYQ